LFSFFAQWPASNTPGQIFFFMSTSRRGDKWAKEAGLFFFLSAFLTGKKISLPPPPHHQHERHTHTHTRTTCKIYWGWSSSFLFFRFSTGTYNVPGETIWSIMWSQLRRIEQKFKLFYSFYLLSFFK
jgi:hypothetical protein